MWRPCAHPQQPTTHNYWQQYTRTTWLRNIFELSTDTGWFCETFGSICMSYVEFHDWGEGFFSWTCVMQIWGGGGWLEGKHITNTNQSTMWGWMHLKTLPTPNHAKQHGGWRAGGQIWGIVDLEGKEVTSLNVHLPHKDKLFRPYIVKASPFLYKFQKWTIQVPQPCI